MKKCLFLDRDGVINKDVGYAIKPEEITFIPDIFSLCNHFLNAGFLIIIVTNQSGIARGFYSENDFQQLNLWMFAEFKKHGIQLTDIFHCPHHPEITGDCDCRKPAPGMLLQAIKKYPIDPQFSIMIGDKESDMEAAKAAGVTTRILLAEHADKIHKKQPSVATHHVSTLDEIIKTLPITAESA